MGKCIEWFSTIYQDFFLMENGLMKGWIAVTLFILACGVSVLLFAWSVDKAIKGYIDYAKKNSKKL